VLYKISFDIFHDLCTIVILLNIDLYYIAYLKNDEMKAKKDIVIFQYHKPITRPRVQSTLKVICTRAVDVARKPRYAACVSYAQ